MPNIPFTPPASTGSLAGALGGQQSSGLYEIRPQNWIKSKPYGFAFYDSSKSADAAATSIMWLPIAPSNLTISTSFATNIVTTLYGVVEEHSETRYYDITIQGTTGFAPTYVDEQKQGSNSYKNPLGRKNFEPDAVDKALNSLGGFLPEVTNTIKQAKNVFDNIDNTLNGIQNPTGVIPANSGYAAFHKLYQFFLKYKQDTSRELEKASDSNSLLGQLGAAASSALATVGIDSSTSRKRHPISFLNYKDGTKYDCIPISFVMTRSANNPMMYNYTIRLRAFNLQGVDNKINEELNLKAKLGLGGLEGQSIFASLTDIAGNATTLVSGLL